MQELKILSFVLFLSVFECQIFDSLLNVFAAKAIRFNISVDESPVVDILLPRCVKLLTFSRVLSFSLMSIDLLVRSNIFVLDVLISSPSCAANS